MAERPIKGSSTGKYNMNFIDPTNDIAGYCNGNQQLQELVDQYFQTLIYKGKKIEQKDLGQTLQYGNKKLTSFNKQQKQKEKLKHVQRQHFMDHCSVCTEYFKQKQQIKMLPCKHCFHKNCIMPWFKNHTKCPNCRFDLYNNTQNQNEQFNQQQYL